MGDPTFVYNQTYDVGTAQRNGVVVRENPDGCDTFAPKMQSYCDAGDPYCANGNDINVHHGYVPEYGAAASAFVVAQYVAWYTAVFPSKASPLLNPPS